MAYEIQLKSSGPEVVNADGYLQEGVLTTFFEGRTGGLCSTRGPSASPATAPPTSSASVGQPRPRDDKAKSAPR